MGAVFAGTLALAAAMPLSAGAAQDRVPASKVNVFVMAEFANIKPVAGQIAGCGVEATAATGKDHLVARLMLIKDGARPGGTVFWLTGAWNGDDNKPQDITRLSIKTASMKDTYAPATMSMFDDGTTSVPGIPVELSDFDTANMMREVMLSGAEIGIETKDQHAATITIPGPFSPSDRATYLHCAGDLFLPPER